MNIDMPLNSSNYLVFTKQYRDASPQLKIIGETCILNLRKDKGRTQSYKSVTFFYSVLFLFCWPNGKENVGPIPPTTPPTHPPSKT